MTFTVEHVEFYMLVLVRVTSFIMAAPFFGYSTIPQKVKICLSILLTIIIIPLLNVPSLSYVGVIGYSTLVVKEAAVGIVIGYLANLCLYIITFAGQIMDMDMGLSMASLFDPLTNVQGTVTGSMYMYVVMLVMMVTNMHYYVVRAIIDSFKYINVGQAVFSSSLKDVILNFIPNYFIIGFRIVLPMFACMLVVNVVLGVLAKAAPQMNMFVIGIQLKLIVGLLVLFLIVQSIPSVSDFIMNEMKDMMSQAIRAMTPK